jgi:hypothetical protein
VRKFCLQSIAVLVAFCACSNAETIAPTTTPTTTTTHEIQGLLCRHDLAEFEISDFPADYVGYPTPEEAVEEFVANGVPLMKPHPAELTLFEVADDSATFLSEDGRPVLILQLVDLGYGFVVEGHRRCGPDG